MIHFENPSVRESENAELFQGNQIYKEFPSYNSLKQANGINIDSSQESIIA